MLISACNSACNTGLMRCTGTGSDDCCVTFDNGVCSNDLTCSETNFVANEQNNYTCGMSDILIANVMNYNLRHCCKMQKIVKCQVELKH